MRQDHTVQALTAALLALGLAACDADRPPPAPADPAGNIAEPKTPAATATDARWDGYGPARFGMDAAQVRAAWNGDLNGGPETDETACFHLNPAGQASPAHFAMMFENGAFVRYSVSNDETTAPGGGRRGTHVDDIVAVYPQLERMPHKYTDGEYLRIQGEGDSVLVFETDPGGTATEWRVGLPPQVDYVEGCS